jgi:ubiquinone/menaquinone biosynthesis C-methylase UbiE
LNNQTTTLSEETHWEKAAKTRMGKYLTRIETDFIFKSINPSTTNAIVDVGAEAGRFSHLSSSSNATFIGIDIASYSLKRLKLKDRNVNAIQADARKIPLKKEMFDAVLMIEVLDYIPELAEAFEECCRILKPDSSLIVSFGNQASVKAKIKGLRGKSYMHSYDKVLQNLNKSGFSVKKKMGYSWLPFGRMSNSRLVPFLAGAEKLFRLRRIPSLSPWVIIHAVKST